jgi:hypothetical protein
MKSDPVDPRHRFVRLAAVLRAEIDRVDRLVSEAAQAVGPFRTRVPGRLELRGLGDIVHDFYTGAERIFERVAPELNGGVPEGRSWHRDLLESMTVALPGIRPPVLRPEVARSLDEYLRFRHLFRNTYGYELEWSRLRPLFDNLDRTWSELRADLVRFLAFVEALGSASSPG